MNNASACFYLSGMYISGVTNDTNLSMNSDNKTNTENTNQPFLEKDMQKAFQFAYKACELNNMYACANLSQMYSRGDGCEKNSANAEKYKKLALEMQDEIKNQQNQLQFQQGI